MDLVCLSTLVGLLCASLRPTYSITRQQDYRRHGGEHMGTCLQGFELQDLQNDALREAAAGLFVGMCVCVNEGCSVGGC